MRSLDRHRRASLACAVVLGLGAGVAHASPPRELLGDPAGEGGLAARFGAPSPASAYFNPALLPLAEPRFEAGVFVLWDAIDIDVAPRPPEADVNLDAAGAFVDDGNLQPVFPPPVPTVWLEQGCAEDCEARGVGDPALPRPRQGVDSSGKQRAYLSIGLVDRLIDERLVLGLSALFPVDSLVHGDAFYNDEREQYFSNSLHAELYADRLDAMSLALGLGSRLHRLVSVGVSLTLSLDASSSSPTFVPDPSRYEELRIDNAVDAQPSLSPHVAVALHPSERFTLSATFHSVQALEIEARFGSLLPDGSDQQALRRFTHDYVPWTLAAGGSYRVELSPYHSWTLVAGGALRGYGDYRDRHDRVPGGRFAWADTFDPTLGVRHRYGRTDSALDFTFVSSPIPEQRGRDNYVGNDRLGLAGSVHYRFELAGVALRAGASAQLHRLLPRSHDKLEPAGDGSEADAELVRDEVPDDAVTRVDIDQPVTGRDGLQTNNPGYPGFASDGWLLGAGVSLALTL